MTVLICIVLKVDRLIDIVASRATLLEELKCIYLANICWFSNIRQILFYLLKIQR